ncbi:MULTISPECIES: hypothetical protein [unclassified Rhodococcus (in: high G+C Gram-positive bacteria)]|uniref:hypothetical protein n=1 Tax=unclassified Rhodococcus (in: high G+C Gram-positive bacteria) TaxID=192944 RepID=UPI00211ABCEA|nr:MULTISPECIES: hypothetical protein [unclassified Rhodococcus (in: high G+C Gram-positive bacteria)]
MTGTGGPEPEFVPEQRHRPNRQQWVLAAIVLAFTAAVIVRKILQETGQDQTAAFYIGIPAVLAIVVVLSAPWGKVIGTTVKVVTVCLLLSMIVLGEGFICVIFAAPLFYGVAILVAAVVEYVRKQAGGGTLQVSVLPVLLLVMASEGVLPATTFPSDSTVSSTRVFDASSADVARAVGSPLRFHDVEPSGILSWGFPAPMHDRLEGGEVEGSRVGDRRVIEFAGAHHRPALLSTHHWGEQSSELTLEVVEQTATSVRLRAVSDTTPLASWLTWKTIDIDWADRGDGRTAVTWTLNFDRELAPAWYFGPIESMVAERAAGYLLDSLDLQA